MNHERKLMFTAIGLFAALSLSVFPSTNMITNAQSDNKTQGMKEDAQGKLFALTQKFNEFLNTSGVNLTLSRDGDLSSKLKELANSSAFKSLSEKLIQAVQELKTNMTNLGNDTTAKGDLSQDAGTNFTQLIQKLKELKDNP
ncbi:MAG: hypothetical protein WB612_05490 [Nitrososphaeraceae archaeon]